MLLFGLSILVISIDQWLKAWSHSNLKILSRHKILNQNIIVLSQVLNRGMAGDRFSNIPPGYIDPYTRYFPTLIWMLLFLLVIYRSRNSSIKEKIGYSFLIGGGASNLVNHWQAEYVIDPLQLYIGNGVYIPFNLADVGIVFGFVLIFWSVFQQWNSNESKA